MVTYTVSVDNIENVNAFETEISYDKDVLELVNAESKLDNTIFSKVNDNDGKAGIVIGTNDLKTNAGKTDVVTFQFKIKANAAMGDTKVTLSKMNMGQAVVQEGVITGAFDVTPNKGNAEAITAVYSYCGAADINGDGKVTIADLSIALANYQSTTNTKCDIDRNGVVDTADFILISGFMAA